jgi:serine protease
MSREASVVKNKYLIVQLKAGAVTAPATDLGEAARTSGLPLLGKQLAKHGLAGKRLFGSVPLAKLAELERGSFAGEPAVKHGLADYWRLNVSGAPAPLEEIAAALRGLPEVEMVYEEPRVQDAAEPADDPLSGSQHYLGPAPVGVGARWLWEQVHGDGEGMQFVDLEQGWLRGHEDLPPYQVIHGDNADGQFIDDFPVPYVGDHGAAVLGIVAGLDNGLGIVGLAPRVTTRTVSHWGLRRGNLHVADALAVAATSAPRPHVILLEVQTDERYPVEVDPAVRSAIRCATSLGIVVVEAAGNRGRDLDAWADQANKQRLNRASEHFIDSGAIMVGAAWPVLPHDRWSGSNFGSRVDCYAWGDGIATAGGWRTNHPGSGYTTAFNGTSGASAIIAGCALLLQGRAWNLGGALLPPLALREMMSNPATGTPQGPWVAGHIGVMPDLQAIVQSAAATNLLSEERARRLERQLAAAG